jgi:ATP synthase protein I
MERDPDKARLDRLEEQIDRFRQSQGSDDAKDRAAATQKAQYNQGMRVVTELIAGIGGGALIGWLFDHWFGTSPWLLILLMVLGTAAAFRNIWVRASQPVGSPPPGSQNKG